MSQASASAGNYYFPRRVRLRSRACALERRAEATAHTDGLSVPLCDSLSPTVHW